MKLFFYFTIHSFINSLKKIFKTWMLILILVCGLIGALIGVGASAIENVAESVENTEENTTSTEDVYQEAEENSLSLEERFDIGRDDIIELAAGGAVLLVLVLSTLSADKNGGKIFFPADIPVLFASPMQPQTVLLFRMGTQMGRMILMLLYLCLQIPNMVVNFGMSLSSAISVIVGLSLSIGVGKLLQVWLYMFCARSDRLRDTLRYWIYGIVAGLFALFFIRWQLDGGKPAAAAAAVFNTTLTRYIPLWGWLKGFCTFAIKEQWPMAFLELGLTILGMAGLIFAIYKTPADFYEDALAKSEQTAEALRRAQGAETSVAMGKRKKDRSEKLRRDGMNRGSGASVFLWKTVYNRFRFAHFGFSTKTLELYLFVAVAASVVFPKIFNMDPFYPVVLILTGLSFYRSLGDTLSTDVKMDFFLLIPGSTETKLFYSHLGNAVDCLLDLLPAMVVTLIMGASPLKALCWMLLILSVDFYGSTISAFMDASTPQNAGDIAKTVVKVMFVYFGLVPDALILAVGMVLKQQGVAICACAAVNILLGLVFLSLIPRYIDPPASYSRSIISTFNGDVKGAKKAFSRVGFGACAFLVVGSMLQLLALQFCTPFLQGGSELGSWLVIFLPLYLLAFPLALFLMGKAPEEKLQKRPLGVMSFVTALIMSVSLMYMGNIMGNVVTAFFAGISGKPAINPVVMLTSGESLPLRILFMVVIAPIIEEFTFRKYMIDRLHIYGQKRAVVISSLLFALFHGNLSQFFYAFLLGLVFGVVYMKTARLRYSVALHMFINFIGGILAPTLLEKVDLDALASLSVENFATVADASVLVFFVYVGIMIMTAVLGLILMLVRRKELSFPLASCEPDRKTAFRMSWGNAGMIVNLLSTLGLMAYVALFQ